MKKINSICIIDDDPITVFGVKKMLSSIVNHNSLHVFNNGKLALDGIKNLLDKNKDIPEIIFLDINMPIMDGWQFLQEFISLPIKQEVRINIITSSIDSLDEEKWMSYKSKTHHCVTYNQKPINKKEICAITKITAPQE